MDPRTAAVVLPPVKELILATEGVASHHMAKRLVSVTSRFVAWWHEQGMDGSDPVALLRPEMVTRWVVETCGSMSTHIRATYRSVLAGLGREHFPQAWPVPVVLGRSGITPPYTEQEVRQLLATARRLRPLWRRRALGAIHVGLATGVWTPDHLAGLRLGHVTRDEAERLVVDVPGDNARRVPCHSDWAEAVAAHARAHPPGWGFLTEERRPTMSVFWAISDQLGEETCPRLLAIRLRHTWIVKMLDAGVRVDVLAQATGIKTYLTFEQLSEYVSDPDPDDAAAALTGEWPA